jgi:hypothetical protein
MPCRSAFQRWGFTCLYHLSRAIGFCYAQSITASKYLLLLADWENPGLNKSVGSKFCVRKISSEKKVVSRPAAALGGLLTTLAGGDSPNQELSEIPTSEGPSRL